MAALTDTSAPSVNPDVPRAAGPLEAVSGATRHLAAGAYLDPALRRVALTEVLAHPQRSVAPSAGFDLAFVLTHCLWARRAAILRDSLQVIVLILCWRAAVVVTLELWTGLALWSAILVVLRIMRRLVVERLAARVRSDDDDNDDDEKDRRQALRPWERWVAARASRRPWLAALAACLGAVALVAVLLRAVFVDLPPIVAAGRTSLVIVPAVVMVFAFPLGWSVWRQRRIEQLMGFPS
jgi:hypothetical protein